MFWQVEKAEENFVSLEVVSNDLLKSFMHFFNSSDEITTIVIISWYTPIRVTHLAL